MFLHVKLNSLAHKVTPIDLSTGKRMIGVICADTDTGFYMRLKRIKGQVVFNKERKELLIETGIVSGGILFTKSKLNMQGNDILN